MRVFGVDYAFLSCGSVFTDGLVHAAADLGVEYAHAGWDEPNLVQQIENFNPDLLFVVHGRRFAQRFSASENLAGVQSAVWLLDEPYEVDDTSAWSDRFDHVFVNDVATLDRHRHASYLPVCYDPHVHRGNESMLRVHDVGFVGGGNTTRDRYLGALARAGLLSYVVGGAWSDEDVNRLCVASNISPMYTAALYQSTRIVLNVFREVHHFNVQGTAAIAMNPRIYEALACGALVVSEVRSEIAEVLPELPTFTTEAECVQLVADLLAHPEAAESIRVRCVERIRPHTYSARLRTVLERVGLEVAV